MLGPHFPECLNIEDDDRCAPTPRDMTVQCYYSLIPFHVCSCMQQGGVNLTLVLDKKIKTLKVRVSFSLFIFFLLIEIVCQSLV